MIEIKHYINEEENEITNSKDDFLNNDELNNKVDLNYNNYKLLKEDLKDKKNDVLSLTFKHKKESKIKLKKKNINKNSSNPFLAQNSFPNNIDNKNKMKILPTSKYCINLKNENSTTKQNKNVGKSIFSKISETLLQNDKNNEKVTHKKIINLEQINEDNYNQLTEELYLNSKANNPSNENNKIISDFLKRKKKEEISKKIGMENDSTNISETLKDLKRTNTLTDRNRSFKSTRTFSEFLRDQKDKEKKHQILLRKNEILQNNIINLNIRDRPLLNEESVKIIKKNDREKIDIHMRLYEEFNEKRKKKEEKEKEKNYSLINNNEIKITKKKIEENSNRLFNEYKIKKIRIDEIKNKRLNEIKNINIITVNKNSNEIIFKKFIKKLNDYIKALFGKKLEDDFDINFNEFLKLLYNLGFISKKYFELKENKSSKNIIYEKIKNNDEALKKKKLKNNEMKNNNKIKLNMDLDLEYKLAKNAWKIIINNKKFNNEIWGKSKNIIFFILSVLGFYNIENNDNKYIKKELQKNKIELNLNLTNLSLQIYKYFYIYRNFAINNLFIREEKRNNKENNSKYHSIQNNYLQSKNDKIRKNEIFKEDQEINLYEFIPSLTYKKMKNNTNQFLYLNNHIKIDNINNKNNRNNLINNSFNTNNYLRKMFLNNPLENDNDIQKKIKGLKDARNQRIIEKVIKEKGLRINDIENNNIYQYNKRFVHIDEPLNNFKNTFQKFEKSSFKQKLLKKGKYIFEIFIENKPKKLIINHGDDIKYKIKEFCDKYNLDYNDKKQIINTINKQIIDMDFEK